MDLNGDKEILDNQKLNEKRAKPIISVGLDGKRALFNKSGLGNYSRNLIEGLLRISNKVCFEIYSPEPKEELFQAPKNHKLKFIRPKGIFNFIPSLWRSLFMGISMQGSGICVYHGLSHELPFFIPKNIKKVVTIHDLIFVRYPKNYSAWDAWLHRVKVKSAIKRADKVIAISEQTKQDLIELFKVDEHKIDVIYQSANFRFQEFSSSTDSTPILEKYNLTKAFMFYVGALSFRKNLKTAIQALSMLEEDLDFVITGTGKEKKKLIELAESLGLKDRVHFLGHVPDSDLYYLYKAAELFVYPSLYEGFGLPILEALQMRTPVVVGFNSCFPEVGGNYVEYVNQESPESLKEGILNILNDRNYYFSQEGFQEHLDFFSNENFSKRMLNFYDELIPYTTMNEKPKLSALLLTLNEEDNIRDYIYNYSFADEILIVDSFSTDKTIEIIEEMSTEFPQVRYLQREFNDFSSQRNFAIDNAENEWIIFFDADERIGHKLRDEIYEIIKNPESLSAYFIYRRFYFKNILVKYSGWQNDKAVRLFQKSKCRYRKDKLVHELIETEGEIGFLKNKLDHFSYDSEEDYRTKLRFYAQLRAKELHAKKVRPNFFHFWVKPYFRYCHHYLFRFGFLDGKMGKTIAQLYSESVRQRYDFLQETYQLSNKN